MSTEMCDKIHVDTSELWTKPKCFKLLICKETHTPLKVSRKHEANEFLTPSECKTRQEVGFTLLPQHEFCKMALVVWEEFKIKSQT